MKKIKYLNLCAGLGGNRKKLPKNVEVTAVESQQDIADEYALNFKDDKVIVGDAFQYLLEHYSEYDVVWLSPPCQRNTKLMLSGRNRKPTYPDLRLYECLIFLQTHFKGKYIIENVIPYYKPLMEPQQLGRHLFWANFPISQMDVIPHFKNFTNWQNVDAKKALMDWLDIHYEKNIYYGNNHCVTQVLRNCVHPDVGLHVFNCAYKK